MAASDTETVITQVPEVSSPANSDTSSASSYSSTESDSNDLECAGSEKSSVEPIEDERKQSQTSADRIPNRRELNGIVTLSSSSTQSVSSPTSSDPEDDVQDMQGEEPDVQASIDEYAPEERIHSLSDPNSQITAVLQSSSSMLWKQFDALGTEMIVTRRGRYVCVCVCVCVW